MNKRIVSILLAIVMIFGSVASFAAEGDIIHTELKKIYGKDNTSEQEEMVNDILNGAAVEKFYREVSDGKYVNIKEEEDAQLAALAEMIDGKGFTTAEEIREYILDNSAEVETKMDEAKKSIPHVTVDIKDYQVATNAPLLTEKNFSKPEPGYKEETTKITTLNLPNDASSWRIQVLDSPIEPMRKDTILEGATGYIKGRDIEIEKDKYLVLYAVDSSNRIKAYANIKITDDMIKQPREEALKLEAGNIEAGSSYAGTVVISNLGKVPEGATKWQVVVSNTPLDKVYKGDKLSEAADYKLNDEVTVANENELVNMSDSFKKYVILIAADNDGKAVGYRIFEVGSDDISKAPTLLKENTNYVGPVSGSDDGTTMFSYLGIGSIPDNNMKEVTKWQAKVYDEKPQVPILNSIIESTNEYKEKENLGINVGQYLLLLGADGSGNVKGYKIFKMEENQVKGLTAPVINESNYTKPGKGSKSGTTKISTLKFDGIDGNPTKWMYVVGSNLQPPMLDKSVTGSLDYVVGEDIKITVGEQLLILATDDEGKVKAYVIFGKDDIEIKDPPPALLKEGVHYSTPVKGKNVGTTKFENLIITDSLKDSGATKWQYVISDKPFDVPELNGKVDEATELNAKNDIGNKNLKGNEYILILATDNDGKVKGYATFQLKESYIKMPDALELETKNYSEPIPGTASGTTRILNLSFLGLEKATQWRYKIGKEPFEVPELNSTIDRSTIYTQGANIPVSIGDYILLLATDGSGKVKAYKTFKLEEKHIKAPNAKVLMPTVNYSEPEPGSTENSTKFGFLNLDNIDGATNWMYKISDMSFRNIEIDSKVEKAQDYNIGNDITPVKEGQYLLLLATDGESKVKAYREFRFNVDQIRGTKAGELEKDKHYKISPGTLPGTSKLTDLGFWGIEGATRWKVKVLENDLDENSKPYTNSIVKDALFYNEGQNIQVLKDQYILLLATDTNSRTKAYGVIQVKDGEIMEYAPELEGINLDKGSAIDTIKVTGTIPVGDKAKIIVQNTAYPTPAVDQVLSDGKDYALDEDISVIVGQYVTIFAVDNENKIKGFKSFEVTSDNIQKATATIKVKNSTDNIIPEGSIVIGGEKIEIKLTNAEWAEDIRTDEIKRANLYNGFKPDNQSTEWQKIVSVLIADGSGSVFVNNVRDTLTILLPEVIKYDIAEKQEVTLTIPANCIDGAINPVKATDNLVIVPTVKATISGDVVSKTIRKSDIVAGGSTIIIELTDGSWKGDIDRDKLIGGFSVIGSSEDTEWSKIAGAIKDEHIVRNSSKKATVTLPEVSGFNLETGSETIKLTILQDLIEGATSDVVATPTFTLYPDRLQVEGKVVDGNNTITMKAPDNKEVKEDNNTWIIEVTEGTLKEEINTDDLIIAGLPRGLKAEAKKVESNKIEISISGIASSSVASDQVVKIRIKGSAITELNSMDSDEIVVNIKTGEAMSFDKVNYSLVNEDNKLALYLIEVNSEMQYSLNSTNGINGIWENISDSKVKIGDAKPMRIFVREKAQPKVFKEVVDLKHEEVPKNVYVETVSYSSNKCTVTLGGLDGTIGHEYSTDGGNTWNKISGDISLDEKSDLRIRKKAIPGTGGKLPSLPTPKLNGDFLGNVTMNVGEGKILDTTTDMEYSLDGNKFTSARNVETSVNFVQGIEVWIRERGKPANVRKLGVVGQQEQLTDSEINNINYNIKKQSINNNNTDASNYTLQYRIESDPWKDINTTIEFKSGSLQFRKKGTETKLPSAPVEKTVIKSPASPLGLRIDDYNKDIVYLDSKGEWKAIDNILEYKMGTVEVWTSGDKWNDNKKDIAFENAVVYVRIAATETELPSQAKSINFTKNLNLKEVKVNVVEGYIENTTTNMEYSTNSIDGKNGTWNSCTNGKTKVELVEGMSIWVREKGKIENSHKALEKVGRCEGPKLDNVTYAISLKTISNSSEQDLEYRIGDEPWKEIDRNSAAYEVSFKPGVFQFRTRGTADKLPSFPAKKTTIKAPESAPNLTYDDVKYTISKIGKNEGEDYEYSVNNSPWIDGKIDTQFTEKDTVKIRKKATYSTLPSQEQTIKFTPNLNLNDVKLEASSKTILNTTTAIEYSLNSTNGLDGTWSTCASPSTKINIVKGSIIYIREKAKPKNNKQINEHEVKEIDVSTIELGVISYDISKSTITIPDTQVGQLQYRFGSSANWININKAIVYNVDFVAGELQFRLKGNKQNLPSKPVTKAVIVATESAPNVVTKLDIGTADKYEPKNIIESINSTTTADDWSNFEYSINNSPWISGTNLKTEDLNRNVEVRIRKIAEKDKLASQIKTIAFKEVLNLKQVGLSTHVSPFELNGTTDKMQYRINGADWKDCTNGNTQLKRMDNSDLNDISVVNKIEIRDINQPKNQYTVYE